MGILPSPKAHDKPIASTAKRRSVQTDFANLKPLKPGGALGFSKFRDSEYRSPLGDAKDISLKEDSDMDSDEDVSRNGKISKHEDAESQDSNSMLSPEDAKRQGELADSLQKIRVSSSSWRISRDFSARLILHSSKDNIRPN